MSSENWKTSKLDKELKKLLKTDLGERGGVVLDDGKVVEFANLAPDPTKNFLPNIAEMIPIEDRVVATWHTHPEETANLSAEDWKTFVGWPHLLHAIVGTDGVRWYRVQRGAVVNA